MGGDPGVGGNWEGEAVTGLKENESEVKVP